MTNFHLLMFRGGRGRFSLEVIRARVLKDLGCLLDRRCFAAITGNVHGVTTGRTLTGATGEIILDAQFSSTVSAVEGNHRSSARGVEVNTADGEAGKPAQ